MFNIKKPIFNNQPNHKDGSNIYPGDSSYIDSAKWNDFITNIDYYINNSLKINENIDQYDIVKKV